MAFDVSCSKYVHIRPTIRFLIVEEIFFQSALGYPCTQSVIQSNFFLFSFVLKIQGSQENNVR
jgi:hypothetical protein